MAPQKKIAFLCFDTAFFVRHFRPVVDAARASGFAIIALLPTVPDEPIDFLDGVEIVLRGPAAEERRAQDVGGGYGVLNG